MHAVDTRDDRMKEKARLDKLAKEYFSGEYQRTIEAIENYDPEAETPLNITNTLSEAKDLLADLDALDKERGELAPDNLDLSEEIPPREWLIRDWLPANCLSMITGEGGVGKSYAALQICTAFTNGARDQYIFKSAPENKGGGTIHRVVYAAWEDERDEVRRRLRRISNELGWVDENKITERLTFVDMKGFGPIWGPEFTVHISTRASMLTPGYQLTKICEDEEVSLLILDPGAGAFGSNENDRAAVREYTAYLNHWGRENNCATLILAHPPKSKSEDTGDYSGSTDWLGSVRSLWNIGTREAVNAEDENEKIKYYSIQHQKSNYAKIQPEIYVKRAEDSGVWIQTRDAFEAAVAKRYKKGNTWGGWQPINSQENHQQEDSDEYDNRV